MDQKFDTIVIGFGKAGKTLAAKLAKQGEKVALIEKDARMYGGTCKCGLYSLQAAGAGGGAGACPRF